MKIHRLFILAIIATCFASCAEQPRIPAIPQDKNIEVKVEKLLKKMTLEEKVGQMTQLATTVVANGLEITPEGEELLRKYKIGSVLNTPADIAQNPEGYNRYIKELNRIAIEETGIPILYGLDHIHGTSYVLGGTLFPQEISLAASFNRELAYNMGKVTAYESRAANVPWTFSPTMDLGRNPEWSRMWESFGEDAYLNSQMAIAEVLGMQGDDPNHVGPYSIAACAKHFMGYGVPVTGQDRTPASIAASELREKHFEPFKEALNAGTLTLMVNSASNNGMPFHANRELLTKWVKEDLKWAGMIVTDWADINNLYTREGVAHDKKEAIEIAINAGIDMTMEPYDLEFTTLLIELVKEGKVSMERIDDAARRVLRLKYRLGLFENPDTPFENYPDFGSEKFAQIATAAAEESEVLLKNENGILPLKKGQKILVTGPNANSMRCLNGGWSYTWQGHMADMFTEQYNTIYEAVCNKFGAKNVVLEQGVTYVPQGGYAEENAPEIEKAVRAARNVDVILACIGENSYCETPGNLTDLALSENQRNLVKALAKTDKPIVLILNEGRPRLINDIEPLADGVIDILLPSNYGGDALANILAGDVNPSGKLPYTYPRHQASLTTYDYKVSEETDTMEGAYDYNAVVSVQWPFGYGLSYTTFEYSNFQCSVEEFGADTELVFTVDVTNTGKVAGKEVVMLYSRDMVASMVPENRRLRAYEKVEIQPGETVNVALKIKGSDLAFVNTQGEWTLEPGEFRMQAGDQTLMLTCK